MKLVVSIGKTHRSKISDSETKKSGTYLKQKESEMPFVSLSIISPVSNAKSKSKSLRMSKQIGWTETGIDSEKDLQRTTSDETDRSYVEIEKIHYVSRNSPDDI